MKSIPRGESDHPDLALVVIRAQRDNMSAIERRVADFILDNAHLLRDYSSQQLASALGISQSSVVNFSQKLGFKGYPDLKYSVGRAIAHEPGTTPQDPATTDDHARLDAELRRSKAAAQEETRLLNPRENIEQVVARIDQAQKVFVCGLGDDGLYAREFAMRLSLLGVLSIHHADPILMTSNLSATAQGDLLVMLSEFGRLPQLSQISRQFKDAGGTLVSITRHTANPLRALADATLVVCAHSAAAHIEHLLYRSSLQYLLDFLFVLLCRANPDRERQLAINLERVQLLLDA